MFNNQDDEFDNINLTKLDNVSVNRKPTSDEELSNKKYVDDSIGEGTIVRFNRSLQNYSNVSVGNDKYHLTKYDKVQITDTTIIKYPITGGYLLQKWVLECNDQNNSGNLQKFPKSTKTNNPTG